jgi:hypothetical protein
LECYEHAIEINPDNENYYYNKSYALFYLDRNNEALDCIEKTIKKFHLEDPDFLELKGLILIYLERFDDAWNTFYEIFDPQVGYDKWMEYIQELRALDHEDIAEDWETELQDALEEAEEAEEEEEVEEEEGTQRQREKIPPQKIEKMTISEFRKNWKNIDFDKVDYDQEPYIRKYNGGTSDTLILPNDVRVYQKDAIPISNSFAMDPITPLLQILAYWKDHNDEDFKANSSSRIPLIQPKKIEKMTIGEFRKNWKNIDLDKVEYDQEPYIRKYYGGTSDTLILPNDVRVYQKDAIPLSQSFANDPITILLQILAYWNDHKNIS